MTIPLADLSAQHRDMEEEILSDIRECLSRGDFIMGQAVEKFERNFGELCSHRRAIGVANGTDAIAIALRALDLPPESDILVPANTFFATAEGIIHAGHRPVFVDVEMETQLIDLSDIPRRLTSRTAALVVVHLYGRLPPMNALLNLTRSLNIKLIEDCAQAFGASMAGSPAGSFGDVATFSFYPSKTLGGIGDGGMIVTADPTIEATAKLLRSHGSSKKYVHERVGYNSRLDTIQALALLRKLPRTATWMARRQEIARRYEYLLRDLPLKLPQGTQDSAHALHLYVVRTPVRNDLIDFMKTQDIQLGIHYPVPCHLQPALASLGYKTGDFPVTEKLSHEIVSLPFYPELTDAQVDTVAHHLSAFFDSKRMRSYHNVHVHSHTV